MSGFVVCPACGTRIKAGRQHCLRCFEPLPDPGVPVRPPIWESFALSQEKLMIAGVVVSVLVVALVAVIWSTAPAQIDDVARPVGAPNGQPAPAAPAAAAAAPETVDPAAAALPALVSQKPAELTAAERGSLEAVAAAQEQTLAKTPDDPEASNNLGQTLMTLGRADDAIARFERASALAPGNVRYHLNIARAAVALGRAGRAIEANREAVRLLPQDFATRYTLALALQKSGDHEAALVEFERAIALAPAEASPHRAYAVSLEQLRRGPAAVREYSRYVEMRPSAQDAEAVRSHIKALGSPQP